MHHAEFQLSKAIIERSRSDNWQAAKMEWRLAEIWRADEPQTCLCGHFPIIEICVIRNLVTDDDAEVGNCCVQRFMGMQTRPLFDSIRRISEDVTKSIGSDALRHAFDKGWLTQWEFEFSRDTLRKRHLSGRQLDCRVRINRKVLQHVKRAAPPAPRPDPSPEAPL